MTIDALPSTHEGIVFPAPGPQEYDLDTVQAIDAPLLLCIQLELAVWNGLAWMHQHSLRMAAGSRIDFFTLAVNLDFLELGDYAPIRPGNWMTGFATGISSSHFAYQPEGRSELHIGAHAAITKTTTLTPPIGS